MGGIPFFSASEIEVSLSFLRFPPPADEIEVDLFEVAPLSHFRKSAIPLMGRFPSPCTAFSNSPLFSFLPELPLTGIQYDVT